ncbi:unnamed protein product [Mesocestoides corti]|uniref:Ion_trans_2 domain-containing protein n=1 Tax=Mesocestoides corti TaxID=53468 RepID=A0A0R3UMT2_MESCO|nr:unnamed protein product [Mesocestoides corti]
MGQRRCGEKCCCGHRQADESDAESDDASHPRRRYVCLRKFLAITCSQLGLLVFIIAYLIGGCFLFTFLERENQQLLLSEGVSGIKDAYEELKGEVSRPTRSVDGDSPSAAHAIGLQCVDMQVNVLLEEVQRLQRRLNNEELRVRADELSQLKQEVTNLAILNEEEALGQRLSDSLQINLTAQIESFRKYTMNASRKTPDEESKQLFNSFVRSVYEAVRVGWVPPPLTETTVDSPTRSSMQPRTSSPPQNPVQHESILKMRVPRTDPWSPSGSLFYVITVITTIGELFVFTALTALSSKSGPSGSAHRLPFLGKLSHGKEIWVFLIPGVGDLFAG